MSNELIFKKQQHSFFDDLVVFLYGVSLVKPPERFGDYFSLFGKSTVSNKKLKFYPKSLLETLEENSWPSEIKLIEESLDEEGEPSAINTEYKKLIGPMVQMAFVRYWASVLDSIENKYGEAKDHCWTDWPEVLNFSRVIRNAFAHGGKIHFDRETTRRVTWKTLSYGHSNNGDLVLWNDLTPVEVIDLMQEIDNLL